MVKKGRFHPSKTSLIGTRPFPFVNEFKVKKTVTPKKKLIRYFLRRHKTFNPSEYPEREDYPDLTHLTGVQVGQLPYKLVSKIQEERRKKVDSYHLHPLQHFFPKNLVENQLGDFEEHGRRIRKSNLHYSSLRQKQHRNLSTSKLSRFI